MSRIDDLARSRRDLPQLESLPIAALAAGSAADPATDFTTFVLPDPRDFWLPFAYNEGPGAGNIGTGVQAEMPLNRMGVRYAAFINDGATNTLATGSTNFADIIVRLYRSIAGGVGVLWGALFWMSLQVSTTLGTAVTAGGAPQTVTPASMNAILPGVKLFIDSGGANPELVTVLPPGPNSVFSATQFTAYFRYAHTSAALVQSALLTKRQVALTPALAALPGLTLPAITAGAGVVVTPNAVSGVNGMYGIHVNDYLLIDTIASGVQEKVLVTAVTATTFTATFANTHAANAPAVTSGVGGIGGLQTAQGPAFEIIEGDVIAFARRSNNATGLATPAGVIMGDWVNSHIWR